MDDFLSILVLGVFYLFVAVNGNKRKKAKNAKRRASRAREATFDEAFPGSTDESVHAASLEGGSVLQQEECATSRIHLHEVTQQEMRDSAEGDDPCHRGDAQAVEDAQANPVFSYDEQDEDQHALVQDVLRGVIMSEILKRPSERIAIRRNGRSTK